MGWPEIIGALLVGLTLSLSLWEKPDPKAAVFSIFFLVLAEALISIRWRLSLTCPHCGFDALLYLKSPKRAADRVLKKREELKADPLGLYRSRPPIYRAAPAAAATSPSLPQRQISKDSNLLSKSQVLDSLNP